MTYTRTRHQIGTMLVSLALIAASKSAIAEEPTPGFNTKIPESIMTPDTVETRIGTLKFFDGIPTKETSALVYNNLDFLRGVEAFLNGIPAASIEGMRLGAVSLGATNSNQVVYFPELMDSTPPVPHRQHQHGLRD
jgi:hypothetical protein